jgi:acyl-CoA-binding protein
MGQKEFEEAQVRVKTLPNQSPEVLLKLYGLFKQASVGDVQGKRPGMLDFKGRAKYDAWNEKKGMNPEQAMDEYVSYVDELLQSNS